MKSFKWKNVYITGGSSGIGLATAKLLASKGANVLILARREEVLKKAVEEIKTSANNETKIDFAVLDVSDHQMVREVLDNCQRNFGKPDILINCAGRAIPQYFENISYEQFDQTMKINTYGTWNTIQALLPTLKKRKGYIINTSSIAGFIGVFGYTDYSASKFAVIGLSEALQQELKPHGISVSVLCPPDTDTPAYEKENQTKPAETKAISEKAKLMKADEVAQALLNGIKQKQFMIIPGFDGKLSYLAKRMAPSLVSYLIQRDIKKSQS